MSQYAEFVYGLKSTNDVITNYRGVFIIGNVGVGAGIALGGEVGLGISAGKTVFVSATDLMVYGETWYLGGSFGVDLIPVLDAGIGYWDYTPRSGVIEYYATEKGKVNKKGDLFHDILYGNHNIWPVPTGPLESTARVYAMLHAAWYVSAYEEIHNEK